MLDLLIQTSLRHRIAVLLLAAALLALGGAHFLRSPVDIFPDLNQPTVTVLAEAAGLAPEEVETLITLPLESALGGAPGVMRTRSSSGDGLSIVRVDFDWATDLYRDRQVVQERLQLARSSIPEDVVPEIAPIASITGEVMNIGLTGSDDSISALDLQTTAEWMVRRRLLSIPGVSEVVVIGGLKKQYQVLADPDLLLQYDISMQEISDALGQATRNTSGGYLVQGTDELLVRNLGRVRDVPEIEDLVLTAKGNRPVRIRDVATVMVGPEYPRGAASLAGQPGVILSVFKQPESNTLDLTKSIDTELENIRLALPAGMVLHTKLYRQATFLQRAVDNVIDALRDGSVLVVLIIVFFLANFRASAITLVAIPLSFACAGIVFQFMDLGLNTMTLGGLAIAVGELVDDAIVGVENVVRRLRQAREAGSKETFTDLISAASSEVRGPIFTGTLIVVLVFLPLFALSGIEGRLFRPMAIAYVASLTGSMLVSLTVTPVLAYFLLKKLHLQALTTEAPVPLALRWLHRGADHLIRRAMNHRIAILVGAGLLTTATAAASLTLGSEFLPPFDEGTVLVMTFMPPGTSLAESDRVVTGLERRLADMEGLQSISRYTGRGEHDEHAPPVTISHILLTVEPGAHASREALLAEVRRRIGDSAGVAMNIGQPLAHRIDHILSGVQAQIAIKIMGPDLNLLRETAAQVVELAGQVPGVTDLVPEPQILVPQVHVSPNRQRLSEVGLSPGVLAKELEMAIGGATVGNILENERTFDLFLRLKESERDSVEAIRRLPIHLPDGSHARLGDLASVQVAAGPNAINRDNQLRRIAVSCNVQGRSLGEVVHDLRDTLHTVELNLPEGTFIRLEGQFQSQMQATRLILLLSLACLAIMLAILYAQFKSVNLALQVLVCVPAAIVGGVGMLLITGQAFNVASLVGFISLAGISTRNGILLVSHYLHLAREEGMAFGLPLLLQAGRERAAPVVMTALTTGAGLLPLLLSAGETGREILYPVASVVIGGLLTSTLFEFSLRPALFATFGTRALARHVGENR